MYTEAVCKKNDYNHRQIDALFNSRIRFASIAYLLSVPKASFVDIRSQIKTTDGNLSIHLRKLEASEYIECLKCFEHRRPLSYFQVTKNGRRAFYQHLLCMQKFCPVDTGFESDTLTNLKIAILSSD
ncbi:transcriptional regulator [Chlorobaculum sp. 24CR]|uniref:winged helix-turn-helix domain-containing protein n=1 Tax=Chlorobaculum sp. 24CR TaxID=2508878 RepID=UPI00100A5527|nr:transcriptional regulator [Chlorobaculum sp. 24CR]RXK85120.1 transcriptional regulator [Chlorobaculum sp. 24CR]